MHDAPHGPGNPHAAAWPPDPRATSFPVLYVTDLARSRAFYRAALPLEVVVDAPRYCELVCPELHVGLLERSALPALLGAAGALPWLDAAPRCELYIRIAPERASLEEAGARLLSASSARDWGERVGYYADPDGHVLAIADAPGGG